MSTATMPSRRRGVLPAERQLWLFPQSPFYDRHGAKNPRWKGGRRQRKDGYVLVYAPRHPCAFRNFMLEHRLVMEAHLGRYLKPEELVHHKNGVRHDNQVENLVLTNSSEHATTHFKGRTLPSRWKPRVSKKTLCEWYEMEKLTIRQCGLRLGISYGAAREHFERYAIVRRDPSSRTLLTRQRKKWGRRWRTLTALAMGEPEDTGG